MKNLNALLFLLPLTMAITMSACGSDNTAGTDEQANSVTAQVDTAALDSAITEWLVGDTLTITDDSDNALPNTSLPMRIEAEKGSLSHVSKENFESIACENDSNWFVYSVNASDTAFQKNLTLPDTIAVERFESKCQTEGGKFAADTTTAFAGQRNFTCNLKPEEEPVPYKTSYVDSDWKEYASLIIGLCRN